MAVPVHARLRLRASTHGMNATDHARFGVLSIETTGPESTNTQAPNAAAARRWRRWWPVKVLRRKTSVPRAAIGSGAATHRLNDTTSDGMTLMASAIGMAS